MERERKTEEAAVRPSGAATTTPPRTLATSAIIQKPRDQSDSRSDRDRKANLAIKQEPLQFRCTDGSAHLAYHPEPE